MNWDDYNFYNFLLEILLIFKNLLFSGYKKNLFYLEQFGKLQLCKHYWSIQFWSFQNLKTLNKYYYFPGNRIVCINSIRIYFLSNRTQLETGFINQDFGMSCLKETCIDSEVTRKALSNWNWLWKAIKAPWKNSLLTLLTWFTAVSVGQHLQKLAGVLLCESWSPSSGLSLLCPLYVRGIELGGEGSTLLQLLQVMGFMNIRHQRWSNLSHNHPFAGTQNLAPSSPPSVTKP